MMQQILCSYRLVELYGEGSWSKLVPHFQGRIGKQLRERWNHELRPDIQKGAWTEEEEGKLVEQHRIHKNAWADIAKARIHPAACPSCTPSLQTLQLCKIPTMDMLLCVEECSPWWRSLYAQHSMTWSDIVEL